MYAPEQKSYSRVQTFIYQGLLYNKESSTKPFSVFICEKCSTAKVWEVKMWLNFEM